MSKDARPTGMWPDVTTEVPESFMPLKNAGSWQLKQKVLPRLSPRSNPGDAPCVKWQVLHVMSPFQSSGKSAGNGRLGAKPLG
jgi:hypothetical protein